MSIKNMSTKDNPLKIQLANQGGGAKICALVAALEAVQLLQSENIIQVTRIAGTSSGAIAGCLFAAGVDMKLAKERLGALTADGLNELFPRPSRARLLWQLVVRQRPLWSSQRLEKLLNSLFGPAGAPSTLQELSKGGVDVRIVASDLTNSRKIVHGGDAPLMNSLLDSAGLPYCFRTWTKSGNAVIVDGGICENLPSDELEQFSKDDGPVVGICFSGNERGFTDDILGFSKSLLNTAMANSEQRARSRLGESVFRIETDIGTFDFERALKDGLADKYEVVRMKAEQFFRNFVDAQRNVSQVVTTDLWATENRTFLEKLGKVYEAQFRQTKCAYTDCSMMVEARSLLGKGEPDLIHNRWEFHTLKEPVYCRAFGIAHALDATSFEGTTFTALDVSKRKVINTIYIPVLLTTMPAPRPLLLFFDPFLPPESGPYRLDFKDLLADSLRSLREKGRDELFLRINNASGRVGRMDLVLFLPKDYPEVKMVPKPDQPDGHLMSQYELASFPPPPNFRSLGWTHSDLEKPLLGIDLVAT